jgi:K+/H+ antiporter YhaU regulatory subunit KhtT
MAAVATLLVVLTLSILTVRVATVALMLTGISRSLARFQARSAFTGCGFTTGESEKITGHPVRRRIVFKLMLLGNVGIITTAGVIVAGFVNSGETGNRALKLLVLFAGLAVLWFVANSAFIDRIISRWITAALKKYTTIDVRDYATLLHISGDYGLGELYIRDDDWLKGKTLAESRLSSEGILVLGINRGGDYVGAPGRTFVIRAGDELIVYGNQSRIKELDARADGVRGALAHADAVAEHKERSREETTVAEEQAAIEKAKRELDRAVGR